MSDISKHLVQLRKNLGLTQAELAEKIGVHQATISKFELGRIYPDQKTLSRLMSSGLDLAKEKQVNNKMFDIAKEIARIKEESGLSTIGFARAVGVNNSYLSRILNGRKKPSIKFLNRVAAESEYLLNQKEENMSNKIGHVRFTFNIENEIFELIYSSYKETKETTHIYTLILAQDYFDFVKFLSKKYPSQTKNLEINNIQKVLLLVSSNKTNYFYTLKIIGDTTGIVTFKPSKFEDVIEKPDTKEEPIIRAVEVEPKEEKNSERDILILCQNIIQIRDLLDKTLELAQKVVQPVVEVKKERKITEVVHKIYKQVLGGFNCVYVGTKTLNDEIIFRKPSWSNEYVGNYWRVYQSTFTCQTETHYDDGTVELADKVVFNPSTKIQEIESSDRKGVIGYVEHKAGIVEVVYYDRFVD